MKVLSTQRLHWAHDDYRCTSEDLHGGSETDRTFSDWSVWLWECGSLPLILAQQSPAASGIILTKRQETFLI